MLQAANRGIKTAGVIMISAQGRRLADVLHEQFTHQTDSATVTRIDTAFALYLRGDDPGEVPLIARPLFVPAYRNYWRSFAAYDPTVEARRLHAPLLIVQGTTDVQLTARDADLLAQAQPAATLVRLENVNHVLKSIATTDMSSQMKTYQNPSLPLALSVVPAVADWIEKFPR